MTKKLLELICWIRRGHDMIGEIDDLFCFYCGHRRNG